MRYARTPRRSLAAGVVLGGEGLADTSQRMNLCYICIHGVCFTCTKHQQVLSKLNTREKKFLIFFVVFKNPFFRRIVLPRIRPVTDSQIDAGKSPPHAFHGGGARQVFLMCEKPQFALISFLSCSGAFQCFFNLEIC